MAFIVKALGAGTLTGAGTTTAYTVPTDKSALVNNIRLVNGNTSPSEVNLFFKPSSGSQVRILDLNKSVAPSITLVVKPELTMNQGDAIQVTTSAQMDFVVSGMQRV